MDQANALKVLTVLCALPNPQSRAHVRFLTMGVNFEWDREAFTQDFAGATWKVVAPLIRHFASQEKELAELDCWRRLNLDSVCRCNFDRGRVASIC